MGYVRMFRRNVFNLLCLVLLCGCALSGATPPEPESAAHLSRGVQYERTGDLDQAMREYELAARTDGRGNFYMGNLLFQQSKFDAAEREYRRAMTVLRADPALYNNLAWLLFTRRQKLEEAEELASLAVKIAGEAHFAEYWDTLEQIRELRFERARKAAAAQQAAQDAVKSAVQDLAQDISQDGAKGTAGTAAHNVQPETAKAVVTTRAAAPGTAAAAPASSKTPAPPAPSAKKTDGTAVKKSDVTAVKAGTAVKKVGTKETSAPAAKVGTASPSVKTTKPVPKTGTASPSTKNAKTSATAKNTGAAKPAAHEKKAVKAAP